eukprot:1295346-Prymnesium_polylepis.2
MSHSTEHPGPSRSACIGSHPPPLPRAQHARDAFLPEPVLSSRRRITRHVPPGCCAECRRSRGCHECRRSRAGAAAGRGGGAPGEDAVSRHRRKRAGGADLAAPS